MTKPHVFEAMIDGRATEIRVHEPDYAGDPEATATKLFKVVVFDAEGRILAVRDRKLIDLPAGRIEWEDDALADATRREVRETAGVTLGAVTLAAVMVATPLEQPERPCARTMVVTGRAMVLPVPTATLHLHRHAFLKPANLLRRCNAGPAELLNVLIEMSRVALRHETEASAPVARKRARAGGA